MTPSDIIKMQPAAWSILARSFMAGRVASTYLFSGDEGLGHWPLAICFTALINCENVLPDESNELVRPCGECTNCRTIFNLNSEALLFSLPVMAHKKPDDLIELMNEVLALKRDEPFEIPVSEKPVSIPISRAREIKKSLNMKGREGLVRVALFYRMDKMLRSSADALLKLIEEPPPNCVIILTAERPEKLLPTIQSRSQKIRLIRVPDEAAFSYINDKYDLTENKTKLAVKISNGNPGQALAMIADDEDPENSLRSVAFLLFKSLFLEDKAHVVGMAAEMIDPRNRSAVSELLNLWQSFIRDSAWFAGTGDEDSITNIDFATELKRLSQYFTDPKVAESMTGSIKNALADLALNVHIQAAIVALILELKSGIKRAA